MKKITLTTGLAVLLLSGCGAPQEKPSTIKNSVEERIKVDATGAVNYQKSLEKIRKNLKDDRKLYEFVAAISLIKIGAEDGQVFLRNVSDLDAEEIILLGKRTAFECLTASFKHSGSPESIRENVAQKVGGNVQLLPPGTVLIIDSSTPVSRDLSLANMVYNSDDKTIFELSAAFDILSAVSLDMDDYDAMIANRSSAELISLAKTYAFEMATKKAEYMAPASLLRGELNELPEPASTPKLNTETPATYTISLGKAVQPLSDQQFYELLAAIEALRLTCENAGEFNIAINNFTVKAIVNKTYKQNPGEFIQMYGYVKQNYPKEKLDELRANFVAYSIVAEGEK